MSEELELAIRQLLDHIDEQYADLEGTDAPIWYLAEHVRLLMPVKAA
jgi:hypothetical protein